MRARLGLVGILFFLHCSGSAPCRPGTMFATLRFDAAGAAATLIGLTLHVGSEAEKSYTVPKTDGASTLGVEVQFASGYPSGQQFALTAVAVNATGTVLGTGLRTGMLDPGCSAVDLSVSAPSGGDLSVVDGPAPPDLASADLAGADLAGADLATADLAAADLAPGRVQLAKSGAAATTGSTSLTLALTPTTPGSLLIITLVTDGSATPTTVSPNWQTAASNGRLWIFYNANYAGTSASVDYTVTDATVIWGQISEWSGASPTAPIGLTVTGAATGTSCNPTLPTNQPAGSAGLAAFAFVATSASMVTFTPTSGWSRLSSDGASLKLHYAVEVSVPVVYNDFEMESGAGIGDWNCAIVPLVP